MRPLVCTQGLSRREETVTLETRTECMKKTTKPTNANSLTKAGGKNAPSGSYTIKAFFNTLPPSPPTPLLARPLKEIETLMQR